VPGHVEPLVADSQPDGAKARRDTLVRAPLSRRAGRARTLPRERDGERVRLRGRRRRGGRERATGGDQREHSLRTLTGRYSDRRP
jgi:hypothetical protein